MAHVAVGYSPRNKVFTFVCKEKWYETPVHSEEVFPEFSMSDFTHGTVIFKTVIEVAMLFVKDLNKPQVGKVRPENFLEVFLS